jgi:hypothetical protein
MKFIYFFTFDGAVTKCAAKNNNLDYYLPQNVTYNKKFLL